MPHIYTLQQKKHALYLLRQLDSIAAVSHQTGVPERTLRDWQIQASNGKFHASRDPALAFSGKSGSITVAEIRDRLLEQIEKLTRSMSDDPRKSYFTALAINHFLNQVKTLNEVIDVPVPPDTPPGE